VVQLSLPTTLSSFVCPGGFCEGAAFKRLLAMLDKWQNQSNQVKLKQLAGAFSSLQLLSMVAPGL
jgi:hypothetical protein